MKDIKDYLYLYLGCECVVFKGKLHKLLGIMGHIISIGYGDGFVKVMNVKIEDCEFAFRHLSDMTEKEAKEIGIEWAEFRGEEIGSFAPKEFVSLLKKSFDLFGLIESGLAIDKTKL